MGRMRASSAMSCFPWPGCSDSESGLRRALSDPSRQAARGRAWPRAAIREPGRRGDPGHRHRAGRDSRWSAPGDLADATEQLAALAVVAQADGAGALDELEDELFRFGRIVAGEPALRVALSSPYVEPDRKRQLLATLLAGKVTPATQRLVTQAALQPGAAAWAGAWRSTRASRPGGVSG